MLQIETSLLRGEIYAAQAGPEHRMCRPDWAWRWYTRQAGKVRRQKGPWLLWVVSAQQSATVGSCGDSQACGSKRQLFLALRALLHLPLSGAVAWQRGSWETRAQQGGNHGEAVRSTEPSTSLPPTQIPVGGSLARVISREVRRQESIVCCCSQLSLPHLSPSGKGKQSTQHKSYLVFVVKIARIFSS